MIGREKRISKRFKIFAAIGCLYFLFTKEWTFAVIMVGMIVLDEILNIVGEILDRINGEELE